MLVLLALCISFGSQFVGGVRFPECSSKRLQVDETANTVITCDQIGAVDAVQWLMSKQGEASDQNQGICYSQGFCTEQLYTLSRISTQSNLTIKPSRFIRGLTKIKCGKQGDTSDQAECQLDVVYPAIMPATSCQVEAKSGSWKVEGSCAINKTYSSMSIYLCQVYKGTNHYSHPNSIKNGTYDVNYHSDSNYCTGSCTFSEAVSNFLYPALTKQDFYFRFTVYPGPAQVVKGPVTIEQPASPTIDCPVIISENTDFTCKCSTTSIGHPAGRLYWSRGGTIQDEGEYGATSLTTDTLNLNRRDNNKTEFSCGVRWAVNVGADVYTANVGFPPSRAELTMNQSPSTNPVTVDENSEVSFTCRASDSNPVSTLTLSGRQSTPLKTGSSPLMMHSLGPAKCEHSALYTCKASNDYGDVTANGILYVSCIPRGDENVGAVNFINDSLSMSFEVTAYPTPHAISFKFLGQNGTETPTAIKSSIKLNGNCVQKDLVYRSTCHVTVADVKSDSAAGFYQISVANNAGTGTFKLQVMYKEPIVSGQEGDDGGVPVVAIVGAVVGVIFIIALFAAIFLFRKRRRKDGKQRLLTTEAPAAQSKNGAEAQGTADPQHPGGQLTFSPADEYAVVQKPKKPAGAAAPAAGDAATNNGTPEDVYAVVDKKAKKNAQPAGESTQGGAKPKTPASNKPKKKEKKQKAQETDEAAHVYGNIGDTNADNIGDTNTDNIGDTNADKKKKKKDPSPPREETPDDGRHVNQDGLIYSSVLFSKESSDTPPPLPKTAEEGVLYSEVTFTRPAAAE